MRRGTASLRFSRDRTRDRALHRRAPGGGGGAVGRAAPEAPGGRAVAVGEVRGPGGGPRGDRGGVRAAGRLGLGGGRGQPGGGVPARRAEERVRVGRKHLGRVGRRTPSRSRRRRAPCTPSRRRGGWPRAGTPTTRCCPRTTPSWCRAWFRLAFGWQHTHAIREPAAAGPVREGLTVRQPIRDEIPVLARLDMVLTDHQALSPTFSCGPPDVYEERVADWEEDFDNPKFWNVVVEHDGAIVGSAVGCDARGLLGHAGPARPDSAALPGVRRRAPGGPRPRRRPRARRGGLRPGPSRRATRASSPTGGRRTCCRHGPGVGVGYRDTFTRVHRLVGH